MKYSKELVLGVVLFVWRGRIWYGGADHKRTYELGWVWWSREVHVGICIGIFLFGGRLLQPNEVDLVKQCLCSKELSVFKSQLAARAVML